jgi:hypothetical protein
MVEVPWEYPSIFLYGAVCSEEEDTKTFLK